MMEQLKKTQLYKIPEKEEIRQKPNVFPVTEYHVHVCPHCGTENEAEALYCEECGTPLGHSRLCPHCRQPLDSLADFCEHCKTYVCETRCSFCGADIDVSDAFCPECGSSRDGIVCPACGTRSPFSYCRVCGLPLTEESRNQSRLIHEELMWKQMEALAYELDNLSKVIPADTPRQIDRNQQNEELCRRVRDLLGNEHCGSKDITMRLGESSEAIDERIAEKRKELQQMLDAIAAQPQENPVLTRNYVMARKPASTRIGWRCNYKNVIHSSPCGCACPQLGGKWIVLNTDSQVEDDL